MADAKPLILIDGSSWLYRAFHALPPLANSRGEPTGAVFGMGNMLRKLCKDFTPERIAVVFDPPGPTHRHKVYPQYKANRDATPEDLTAQYPLVLQLIEAMGLPMLQVPAEEADDVIGTLVCQARDQKVPVLIVTADKDMAQLVDEHVKLLDTMKNRTLDATAVEEKFGVPPRLITDYLALVGDTSDNIPGVPLVGPKTAAKWLAEYGSLDALVARSAEIKGKAGENLRAHLAQLPLARELATIRCDLKLAVGVEDLKPRPAERDRQADLFKRIEARRWLEDLAAEPAAASKAGPASAAPAPAPAVEERPAGAPSCADLVLDETAFAAMLAELEKAELICLDTETDGLDAQRARLVGISFATRGCHGWYVPLAHDYIGAPPLLPQEMVLARLKPLLEDPRRKKIGQNIKFDLNVLHRYGIAVAGVAYDTMLESYVLDASGRHDMDSLAEQHLNYQTLRFKDVAGKGRSQIVFSQVSVEQAAIYSAEDADIALRLHHVLHPRIRESESLTRVFETVEMPLVPVLAQMERTGVLVDRKLLAGITEEFGGKMEEHQAQAWKEAGQPFALGSPPQLQQILYEKLGLPVLGRTPKGQPSTAEDVLEQLASQHPLPRLVLDWRVLQKLCSTYTQALPQQINPRTGRIHTCYHQAVAATGRLSSADPNLQNIPIRNEAGRRIRQAFIAAPGAQLISIDYSQIELRLMAHFSGDARLQQAFRSGQDIHHATAAEVFGLAPEAVTADQRRAAKAINFGLIYGISAFGLARQLGIGRQEAQAYMETFFTRYPGVKRYMDRTREEARERGYVETMFGRRLYLKDIRSRNAAMRQYAERTAINAPLQGTAADLIKLAMVDLDGFLQAHAPEVKMILQVHDELVFEGPENAVAELAPRLADRMCRLLPLEVPLVAGYGWGSEWNQAHNAQGTASGG